MKPNVILIMVDQMRGDCLGIQGHPVVKTPNLDMMAREGVVFTSAYSAVPSCIAARAAVLTGLSQRTHGRVGYQDGVPWNYEHTLPGEFSKAGYHTQCIGKMHVHPARNLLGFHNVVLHDGYLGYSRNYNVPAQELWQQVDDYLPWFRQHKGFPADIIDSGLQANSWVARSWPYEERLHPTNWVVTQSIDFLRRRDPTKPFFLMPSFVRPHAPLDPPQVYMDMYANCDMPLPPIGEWAEKDDVERNGLNVNCFKGVIGEKALRKAMAAYYALITHIDLQIGRLLQVLQEYNVLNNTLIMFVSDHGEMLGDHNIFRKYLPYRGSALVPMIIYDPGKLLGCKPGSVVGEPVELRDIMPTLLDFAGLEVPPCVEGKSIITLLKGDNANWREYIHGEHAIPGQHEMRLISNHYLVSSKEKYIWFSQTGREQYFNLENDLMELHDLSSDTAYKNRVEYWRRILVMELEGREEGYSDGEKLITGREPLACLNRGGYDE